MQNTLLKIEIKYEHDVVLARQRARQIAELLAFDAQDQVRIATAVSEIARNAFQYAGGGRVEFVLKDDDPQLLIRISDKGPGIGNLKSVLDGNYISKTGMGLGIIGAKRLMDHCHIESDNGTVIELSKALPRKAPSISSKLIADITEKLTYNLSQDPFAEIQRQNQELLTALDEVQRQRTALTQLNQELEETNRGVVALYAELDERADFLRRASDLKSQFLSNMTHEFRTPLNSIRSISDILLARMDGELTAEQEKQVKYIQTSASTLSDMVNDILDLAKVEAGKVVVRPTVFTVSNMFGMLRGMLKPLLNNHSGVSLIFEEPDDLPVLETDEGKVSQILRNFISNGLKYTPKGEVRVKAEYDGERLITFSVTDTGIGISAEDQQRIFDNFTQIENVQQKKYKGTGLGLPLSKKLAELLGGYVSASSKDHEGSTFSVTLPIHYNGPAEANFTTEITRSLPADAAKILIIDDDETDRYILKKNLIEINAAITEASCGVEGLRLAQIIMPDIIFLDFVMPDLSGLEVLRALKNNQLTCAIPVIIYTSKTLDENEKKELVENSQLVITKGNIDKENLSAVIDQLLSNRKVVHKSFKELENVERSCDHPYS